MIFILDSCCIDNVRGSYLEINFGNFDELEISDFEIIKKESTDSLEVDFTKTSESSLKILIDETTNSYKLYVMDSNLTIIDSITQIVTLTTNDSSNCTDGDYEYEYKFVHNEIETEYSQNHEIEINKQDKI